VVQTGEQDPTSNAAEQMVKGNPERSTDMTKVSEAVPCVLAIGVPESCCVVVPSIIRRYITLSLWYLGVILGTQPE
jgi:hypothetical protein